MRTLAFRAAERNDIPQRRPAGAFFYLQPTLGGPNDLRGYERYRYYGNGSSVLSGEYRWSVAGSLELAIFGDGGNVYSRPGLIGLRELRGDGGFGVRFKSKQQEVVRVDLGVSPEGVKVWFVFQQRIRKALSFVLVGTICQAATLVAQQFLSDDPIKKVPETESAQKAAVQDINAIYDFVYHSYKYKAPPATPSLGVNTLERGPRFELVYKQTKAECQELKTGTRVHGAPQPPFTVVAAKTEGVTPGFRIKDGRGLTYFIQG